MLLPIKYADRFGNEITVDYYYKFSDSSTIYGRPLLKRVGDFYFDWGNLLDTNGIESEFKIYTDLEDTLYTIEMGDLEQNNVASIGLEHNRALVADIHDALGRTESFGYLFYKRRGEDRLFTNPVVQPSGRLAAKHFSFEPRRLYILTGMAGGITRFRYINDNVPWNIWPSWNTSVGSSFDDILVDFDYSRACDTNNVPCYQSDGFPNYGRDPFFVNMTVGKVRYQVDGADTSIISHDSLLYSWVDDFIPDTGLFSEADSFVTLQFQDSTLITSGLDGGRKDSLLYKQYKEWPGLTWNQKDRDWEIKQLASSVFDWRWVIDEYTWVEVQKTINYWRIISGSGRLLLDSVETYEDLKSQVERYEYEYVKDPIWPSFLDTLVNIVMKATTDAFGVKSTSLYNDEHFTVDGPNNFYTNSLFDSQITSTSSGTIAKSFNKFYGISSDSGYIGQLAEKVLLEYLDGQLVDTLTRTFEYYVNAYRQSDNGALKAVVDPLGNIQEYSYYEFALEMLAPDPYDTITTIANFNSLVHDTTIISDSGYVVCELIIDGSNGAGGTTAKIWRNSAVMYHINGCVDYCSDTGSFSVVPGDLIITGVNGHQTDSNVVVTSQAILHRYAYDSVFNPVTYYEHNNDGSIDTVFARFDSNGPFWYKKVSYVGIDSIVGGTIYSDTLTNYRLVDSLGNLRSAVDLDQSLLSIFFDEIHRVERIVLPYNYSSVSIPDDSLYTIRRVYDDNLADNEVSVSQFVRIDSGHFDKSSIIRFDGFWRNVQTDSYDNVDTTTVKRVYDFRDRVEVTIDQTNFKQSRKFDNLDRKTRTTYPDSIQSGNISDSAKYSSSTIATALPSYPFDTTNLFQNLWVMESLDENGHKREELLDARNQLRAIKNYTGTDPYTLYATTYFDYDDLGNLVAIQRPEGDKVQYEYNSIGWLTKEWAADYDTIFYLYDKNGNLTRKKDGNHTLQDSIGVDTLLDNASVINDTPGTTERDTIYVKGNGYINYHLSIIESNGSGPTFVKINLNGSVQKMISACTGSCDSTGSFNVSAGDIVDLDARVKVGDDATVSANADLFVQGTVSNWTYYNYDAINRLIETGLIRVDYMCYNTCWDADTISIKPERTFCYDQSGSSNSEGLLSFVYSTFRSAQPQYKYAEKYNYDARGRLIHQENTFDDEIDSTLYDSLYVDLLYETGADTVELVLPRDSWVPYKLTRTVSGSGNFAKILKNGTLVASNEDPNPSTIEDSVHCVASDTITLIVNSNTTSGEIKGWAWYVNHSRYQKFAKGSNGRTFHIWYEYNDAGQITSITYPDSSVVTYRYDDRVRLDGVGDSANEFKYAQLSYTDRNEVSQMILGSSLQTVDYDYNARGWLNSINYGDTAGSDLFGQQLFYYDDGDTPSEVYYNGNILGQKINIEGDTSKWLRYQYDEMDRLVDVNFKSGMLWLNDELFEYDQNGNRTMYAVDSFSNSDTLHYEYLTGTNIIDSVYGESGGPYNNEYLHDDNGNLIYNQLKGLTFYYDIFSQLDHVILNHSSIPDDTIDFLYNVSGERVYKTYRHYWSAPCPPPPPPPPLGPMGPSGPGGGTCTYNSRTDTYYIRSKGKVLAEYSALAPTAKPLFRYIYAGDQRIAMRKFLDVLHFYLNDHLGSAGIVIDSTGTVKDKYKYRAFGQLYSEVTNTGQDYKYTGKPFDEEADLDLYYYGARYYDATLGRFCAVDRLANKYPDWSPYVYTLNNPLRFVDPDGLASAPVKNAVYRTSKSDPNVGKWEAARTKGGKPSKHMGVDIAAKKGTPLTSPVTGKVKAIGFDKERIGNYVIITSTESGEDAGLEIQLLHLEGTPPVKAGDEVVEGETVVGKAGTTGNAKDLPKDQQHVHVTVKDKDGKIVDPSKHMKIKDPPKKPDPQSSSKK